MSRYSYAGGFQNPTDEYNVEANPNGEGFILTVNVYCECGEPCCSKPKTGTRPHTNGAVFEDEDQAYEYLESLRDRFEEDYDDYLEENRHAIVQAELYEMWRNEY